MIGNLINVLNHGDCQNIKNILLLFGVFYAAKFSEKFIQSRAEFLKMSKHTFFIKYQILCHQATSRRFTGEFQWLFLSDLRDTKVIWKKQSTVGGFSSYCDRQSPCIWIVGYHEYPGEPIWQELFRQRAGLVAKKYLLELFCFCA